MKMFQGILFVMSLSGSVMLIFYYLLSFVFGYHLALKNRYFLLKAVLFFYLIPVGKLKFILSRIFCTVFPPLKEYFKVSLYRFNTQKMIWLDRGIKKYTFSIKIIYFLMIGIVFVGLAVMLMQMIKYEENKKSCLNHSHRIANPEYEKIRLSLKQEFKFKYDVHILSSVSCHYPMVVGIRSPVILVPEEYEDMLLQKHIIRHEFVHILHRDLLLKILAFCAVALHWYNPMVYVLFFEIEIVSELVCDKTVMQNMPEDERKAYANLVLDMAVDNRRISRYSIGFISDYMIMKRRILEMKKQQIKTRFSAFMTLCICFSGAITSFAYTPAPIVKSSDCYFNQELIFYDGLPEVEAMPWTYFFTSADGTMEKIEEKPNRANCKHDLQTGTATTHQKNRDGSCTVTKQEAKKCTYCNYTELGDVISVTKYPKCPH